MIQNENSQKPVELPVTPSPHWGKEFELVWNLADRGKSHQQIAEALGWSEKRVSEMAGIRKIYPPMGQGKNGATHRPRLQRLPGIKLIR